MIFSDGKASGTIILLDKQTIILNDINIIERNDRIYIIDKQNDLKIFAKQLSLEKYLILIKINSEDIQTKLRFIGNSENVNKNTNQRNLFDAMEQKTLEIKKEKLTNMTQKELQLLEKQKGIDAKLKIHEDRLARIAVEEAKKPHGDKTSQSILNAWKNSQEITGMGLVIPEKIEEKVKKSVVVNHIGIETFLSIPHYQEWGKVLRYTVLVTDDSAHKFDSSYGEFVGNELLDVSISGTIKNPSGETIQSFNGTTYNSGEYLGTFFIPTQITTRGEYVISVDAVKTFSDNATATSSNSGIFFVFPSDSGSSFNNPPIANAGEDIFLLLLEFGNPVSLDGSASSDPDGDVITFSWIQITGTDGDFDDAKIEKPVFTPLLPITENVTFELTVTDTKGKSDTATVDIIIPFGPVDP